MTADVLFIMRVVLLTLLILLILFGVPSELRCMAVKIFIAMLIIVAIVFDIHTALMLVALLAVITIIDSGQGMFQKKQPRSKEPAPFDGAASSHARLYEDGSTSADRLIEPFASCSVKSSHSNDSEQEKENDCGCNEDRESNSSDRDFERVKPVEQVHPLLERQVLIDEDILRISNITNERLDVISGGADGPAPFDHDARFGSAL
jgi:hypothetical protein